MAAVISRTFSKRLLSSYSVFPDIDMAMSPSVSVLGREKQGGEGTRDEQMRRMRRTCGEDEKR